MLPAKLQSPQKRPACILRGICAFVSVRQPIPKARGSRFPRLGSLVVAVGLLSFSHANSVKAQTNVPPKSVAARVEQAQSESALDKRLNALANVGKSLSLSEIPSAIKVAEQLTPLRERTVLTESTLKHWGELAPAEAFLHASGLPESSAKVDMIHDIVSSYARRDIQGAAAAVVKMKPGRSRNDAIEIVAENWASIDVEAALKWVNNLPSEGYPKARALQRSYFTWVHSDPAAASSVVQNLPPGDYRNALLMNVAAEWAARNPSAAIEWAESLTGQQYQELALTSAVESWADTDPNAAAKFAAEQPSPQLRQRTVVAALNRWAAQDPRQALSWIAQLSERELQERAITEVLNICVPMSPEPSTQWIEQIVPAPLRDRAIGSYVEAVIPWNPEAGARLAVKTADPSSRQQRVEQCLRLWLLWAPDSAKQWLETAKFGDDVKNRWVSEFSTQEQ